MEDDKELLSRVRSDFHAATDFSLRVSKALDGKPTTKAGEYASIVHQRMCVNAVSIDHQFSSVFFDHTAIVVICRMIMEAMILYFYLMEPIDSEQWECRNLLLRLHDTINRIKLMRAFQSEDEYADLIEGRKSLENALRANSWFNSLQGDQQKRLLTGEHFYVRGVRVAVRESAGWNERAYFAMYSYFSSQAHSAPMSFFRFKQHKIDFAEPSDPQRATVSTAISVAESCLVRASISHLDSSAECRADFDQAELQKWKAEAEKRSKDLFSGNHLPSEAAAAAQA
jgi:hypothetical protein